MVEPAKFRLVRCPKCENLLQEPSDSSVYQCGGCCTVLRVKKKGVLDNDDLDVSDEHKNAGVSDRVGGDAAAMVVGFKAENAKNGFELGELDENAERSGGARGMGSRAYINRDIRSKDDRFKPSLDVVTNDKWIRDGRTPNPNPYGGLSFDNKLQEFMPSKPVLYPRNMDRNQLLSSSVEARRGFHEFQYPDEGPSSYHGTGSYGAYMEQAKYDNELDARARVEILENDRADLLRKLDELAGMLKNTNNPGDELRRTGFRDLRIPPEFMNRYDRNDIVRTNMSYGMSNEPISGHSYMPRGHGYDSNMDRYRPGSSFSGSYHSRNPMMQEYRGFGDVHNPQMLTQPSPLMLRQPSPQMLMQRPIFRRQTHELPYGHVNPVVRSPQGYVTEESNVYELPQDPGMETCGFGHQPLATQKDIRVVQPFSGAAPFITCCICFEVLKMPKKFTPTKEVRNTMKCGACTSLLLFEFENNGMILSVPPADNELESNDQDSRHPSGFPDNSNSFDGYENYTFVEDDELKTDLGSQISDNNVSKSGHDQHSFSSIASVDEPSPDSPFDKSLDQISSEHSLDRKEESNEIKSFGQDYNTSRQNSSKGALMATEMYVSYDDTPTKNADQSVSDISTDNDKPRINKKADSFFKGFIKKSFRDLSKSRKITESRRTRVSVNGHVISNWLVKKAEKLAGPIEPGDYWYDYDAGFWGVMGYPCLGIIMPNIDEFNYPMPESCAAGNTEVFLNGRELHQKDLDLLSRRGLPTTKDKSYLIQISGITVDEDTGEELDLGKLAPTVEIAQHGFGMKVPSSIQKQ